MNRRTLFSAVSGIWLIGCGSSDGTFRTGVNGSIPLNDLSSEQATQFCNEVNAANEATLGPTYCASQDRSSALLATDGYRMDDSTTTDADLRTDCSRVLGFFEADPCPFAAICDATTVASDGPDCMGTVADAVNCINENDALARELLAATPTCEALTMSSLSAYLAPGGPLDTDSGVSMSASCQALAGCFGITTLSNFPPPGS
jgi:hypothetical protein